MNLSWKAGHKGSGLEALHARLKNAGFVKIGVVGDMAAETHADGVSNAALAAIHEYGAPSKGIPERAPIRRALEHNRKAYVSYLTRYATSLLTAKLTTDRALELLGLLASNDVKRFIKQGLATPENTPEVFLRKLLKGKRGFNRSGNAPVPLIDTAQLLNAYSYEVVHGG